MDSSPSFSKPLLSARPKRAFHVCSVSICHNNTFYSSDEFFPLPKDDEMRRKWLKDICREDLIERPMVKALICANHFKKDFIQSTEEGKVLDDAAYPELKLPVRVFTKNTKDNTNDASKIIDATVQTEVCTNTIDTQTEKRFLSMLREYKARLYLIIKRKRHFGKAVKCQKCKKNKKWSEFNSFAKFCTRVLRKSYLNVIQMLKFVPLCFFGMLGFFYNTHFRISF